MENNIEIKESGLLCDNIKCDWKDESIKFDEMSNWINKPCPKCGENVLTYEDFKRAMMVKKSVDFVNSLSKEELNKMADNLNLKDPNKIVKVAINTHNDISFKRIEDGK